METADLKYSQIVEAVFLERPNRFVAKVILDGGKEWVHVKNTGRCGEILIPGTKVYLEESANPKRKMRYSLVAAYKGDCLINIDSQAPNRVVGSALRNNKIIEIPNIEFLKPEVTFGRSRFDFYYETRDNKGFIEVKGVTLERDGIALFPDAPTERGTRHLEELVLATQAGYRCAVVFLVQLAGVSYFCPNRETDAKFAEAVAAAEAAGVRTLAYGCRVTPEELTLTNQIRVCV
ncbi:MAG TPA: DNA/RNA nuclease SfsA [Bacillota bacterium]|nr:DNA/RNA nuclease SfsA [Bacillota bacterium]